MPSPKNIPPGAPLPPFPHTARRPAAVHGMPPDDVLDDATAVTTRVVEISVVVVRSAVVVEVVEEEEEEVVASLSAAMTMVSVSALLCESTFWTRGMRARESGMRMGRRGGGARSAEELSGITVERRARKRRRMLVVRDGCACMIGGGNVGRRVKDV